MLAEMLVPNIAHRVFLELKIPNPDPGDPCAKFDGLNNLFSKSIKFTVSF